MVNRLLVYYERLFAFGGITRWIIETSRRLTNFNWRITVLTTNISLHKDERILEGLKNAKADLAILPKIRMTKLFLMPTLLRFIEEVQRHDLFYWAQGFFRPLSDALMRIALAKRCDIPVVIGRHCSIPYHDKLVLHVEETYYRMLLPLARSKGFYHAISYDEYNYLRSLGYKVFLVPNGINTEFFKPLYVKEETFTILMFFYGFRGKRSQQKGSDFVPTIINAVLRKTKDLHIVVNAKADHEKLLKMMPSEFRKRVHVVTNPGDNLLRVLYAKSHLFVFPSRWEGMPLTSIEAMACGTPVVAFDIPGVRDIVKHGVTGYLDKPYNVKSLINAIIMFYRLYKQNPSAYDELCRKARLEALKYDWNNIVKKLNNVFIKLLYHSKR